MKALNLYSLYAYVNIYTYIRIYRYIHRYMHIIFFPDTRHPQKKPSPTGRQREAARKLEGTLRTKESSFDVLDAQHGGVQDGIPKLPKVVSHGVPVPTFS